MNGFLKFHVTCFMTPKDLREIADEMERRWPELRAGQTTNVKEWSVDENVSVVFSMDQERCRRQLGMWGESALRRFRESKR